MNVIELKQALLEASRVSTTTKHRPLMTQAIGEIASLQAENERLQSAWEQAASQSTIYEGELRKITAFHLEYGMEENPLYGMAARRLIGSLEGIKG